ncbi:hypothetical protein [Inhella sp.]|uniref:hypothetical protein n=1 Tax=Inhella sp. TaxID=1921806 RepID=UPI0035B0143A
MESAPALPTAPAELPAWLAAQRSAYRLAPERAAELLTAALSLAQGALAGPALAAWVGTLALELRSPLRAQALLVAALAEPGLGDQDRALLEALAARADIQAQRLDAARERLQRALLAAEPGSLAQGLALGGSAQLAYREGAAAAAVVQARQALALLAGLEWEGPWVQLHALLALAQRELGDAEGRQASLQRGCALALAQQRWGEAALLTTGLFDLALEQGQPQQAEQALQQASDYAAREPGGAEAPGHAMVVFSRARWLAARGDYAAACAGLREALSQQRHRLAAHDLADRLNQLADWLVLAEQPTEALAAAREAQQLQLLHDARAGRRHLDLLRQQSDIERAEQERAASETRVLALERHHADLAATLARQRALHDELVEARKLAGLGQLLIGLAGRLEAPLQRARQQLEAGQASDEALLDSVRLGAGVSRRALQQGLQQTLAGCQRAQRELEQALAEVSNYQSLRDEV